MMHVYKLCIVSLARFTILILIMKQLNKPLAASTHCLEGFALLCIITTFDSATFVVHPGNRLFQRFRNETVSIGVHMHDPCLVGTEHTQGTDVARRLCQHHITRVEEEV